MPDREHGLIKAFGRKVVLHELELDVGVGESVVVIGGRADGPIKMEALEP